MTAGTAAPVAPSRPAVPADGVLGVTPSAVYSPRTPEEAAAVLEEAARSRLTLLFAGGRTQIELGAAPRRLDAVVDMRGLSRIVEHAPSDQIVVAEAGVTLAALQALLAESRQRVALDPPLPERATVGGLIASNVFGPLRARYGSIRDLLIGVSFVRADGTVAHGGGKVVKNVAGFDLPKLLTGSLGTLGLITTATFRLHPVPEASATVLLPGRSAASVRDLVKRLVAAQLEPAAVVALAGSSGSWDVAVRFEGFEAGVAAQRDGLLRAAAGSASDGAPPEVATPSAAESFFSRHDAVRSEGSVAVRFAAPRSEIEAVSSRALPPLLAALEPGRAAWYPTLGLGFASGTPRGAEEAARAVSAAREAVSRLGGSLVVTSAPPDLRAAVDLWGPPPPSLPLLRAMKERLDPDGRLAPGRFVGGL